VDGCGWFNAVGNKKESIGRLQMDIRQLHGCDSTWEKTVPVVEEFRGQTVWDGDLAADPQNAVKVSIVAAAKKAK
jgi:hypothetical protein